MSGANTVLINSSGNSYLNGGNVGIGITSPANKLHVRGGTSVFRVDSGSDDTWLEIRPDSNRSFNIGDIEQEYSGATIIGWTSKDVIEVQSNLGVGTSNPSAKLDVNGGIRMANDSSAASASNVGTLKYYTSGNNSYVDMCMQTGASTYAWVNIVQNNW